MENTLLNLVPASYLPEVHLSQYDVGRELKFTLKDGSSDYTVPSGAVVTVKATKPSGLGFVVNAVAEGSVVTLSNTETMTKENGRFPAELSITQGSTVIGTSNFIFNIERSPHPEGTIDGDAESLLPELTLLVERIEAAADSVDEDTQTVTEAKAEVLQAKADTLQAKADTLTARDDALQAKADAITAKESAEASAQAAAESAQEAEDTLSDYAKVDGYYEEMAVGSAEQLLSTQFVEDSVPYKFRTSGGSKDIGNREYDEIVGGSIVWNQLWDMGTGTNTSEGITCVRNGSKISYSGTFTGGSYADGTSGGSAFRDQFVVGHRYLITISSTDNRLYIVVNNPYTGTDGSTVAYNKKYTFYTPTAKPTYFFLRIKASNGEAVNGSGAVNVFDLTAMFGSTIADYIYSLETAQSGKGVALFKSLFPNDYYPYNAGELMSVEGLQSHDTVGFNQFDIDGVGIYQGPFDTVGGTTNVSEEAYIPMLPNTTYYFRQNTAWNGTYIRQYDSSKTNLSAEGITKYNTAGFTFTTSPNTAYIRVMWYQANGMTPANIQNDDVCINLSWSGWRNGEYEPYKKHSYALDSSLTLRGIPKLNAQNELYFDGDIYSYDRKVTRKCGVVDLGSLNYVAAAQSGVFYTSSAISTAKAISPFISPKYQYVTSIQSVKDNNNSGYIASDKTLYLNNTAYTDAASFKSAMSGVYLIYELATPTEETAEPYTSPQNVDDFGTEEYISGNLVPVGHNTKYPANLRDKLQHLPDLPSGDGFYLIQVSGTQMTLNPFRIPMMPTTDGTYILKATVSGGTPTASWVLEE